MLKRPFPAYDGDEPFIFVSYSHADSKVVFGELARLRESGFNLWYDEGISPGSRWTDDLADRISTASLVLLFVTPNSVSSENCRNEIDFALEQKRNVLLVYLKPAQLPGGMKLALSGRQAILKYEHSEAAYQNKLLPALEEMVHPGEAHREFVDSSKGPRRSTLLAVVAVVLLSVAAIGGYLLVQQRGEVVQALAPAGPLPVLIADFVNETDQPVFNGVLEEALKVGMEGAPFITSYPRADAVRVLTQLTEETALTHEAARLVAVREDVDLVLAGTVRQRDEGYELEVLGIDSLTGEVRLSASEFAGSPLEALTGIASLAETLRRRLGDVTVETTHLEEVFTSSSMLAVSEFAQAQALAADWQHAEALEHYARAAELDPKFGRAYGGWAYSASALGQTAVAADLWEKCLARLNTMTERERLRTLGIYYVSVTGSVDKAIDTYEELIRKYPADAAAHNNLAVAYFSSSQLEKARDAGRALLEIYPASLLYMGNYALFNMYVTDTEQATEYAARTLEKEPRYYVAYLPMVLEALLDIDYVRALKTYESMAETGVAGLSLAQMGRADVALARGDYKSVITILQQSIALDEVNANLNNATTKSLWLAHALLATGQTEDAEAILNTLHVEGFSDRHELALAQLNIQLGDFDAAIAGADRLSAKVPARSRATSYLVRGAVMLAQEQPQQAIEFLNKSLDIRDSWFAHYMLGRAYLQVDAYTVEAMDELDAVWQRRGEGFAMFLDDAPTYSGMVDVPYWLGRAQEALGMKRAALTNYLEFLQRRDLAAADLQLADARQRVEALGSSDVSSQQR